LSDISLFIPAGNPGEISFVCIFEETVDFKRPYKLPYNTLVGILYDGGQDNSPLYDLDDNTRYSRRTGWIYFTPAGKNVLYNTKKNLRYIAIHFNMELYPGLDVFLNSPEVIFEYAPEGVQKMEEAFRITDPYYRASCFREICLNFCNRHWQRPMQMDPARLRFDGILRYIREEACAETTVQQLAELVAMRHDSFSREFTTTFGMTPKMMLQTTLVRKAANLLQNSAFRNKEMAAQLKFRDEYYFSKFFHRSTGCSPLEYRKRFKR
jgi:AraC-like DNA-binding protein